MVHVKRTRRGASMHAELGSPWLACSLMLTWTRGSRARRRHLRAVLSFSAFFMNCLQPESVDIFTLSHFSPRGRRCFPEKCQHSRFSPLSNAAVSPEGFGFYGLRVLVSVQFGMAGSQLGTHHFSMVHVTRVRRAHRESACSRGARRRAQAGLPRRRSSCRCTWPVSGRSPVNGLGSPVSGHVRRGGVLVVEAAVAAPGMHLACVKKVNGQRSTVNGR
jgi:hypothetical protein